jgi:hypothetical protein
MDLNKETNVHIENNFVWALRKKKKVAETLH